VHDLLIDRRAQNTGIVVISLKRRFRTRVLNHFRRDALEVHGADPGFTATLKASKISRTRWPLRRIFSISAADLQTMAMLFALEPVTIARLQSPTPTSRSLRPLDGPRQSKQLLFRGVVTRHGTRLGFVRPKTLLDYFFTVIVTKNKLRAFHVAGLIGPWRLKMNVIDAIAGRTGPAAGKPHLQ